RRGRKVRSRRSKARDPADSCGRRDRPPPGRCGSAAPPVPSRGPRLLLHSNPPAGSRVAGLSHIVPLSRRLRKEKGGRGRTAAGIRAALSDPGLTLEQPGEFGVLLVHTAELVQEIPPDPLKCPGRQPTYP